MRAVLVAGAGVVVAGLAVATYLVVRPADPLPEAVAPPIMPVTVGAAEVSVPAGFLLADERSQFDVADQGMRWDKVEGLGLPPLVSPCGGALPSETDVVGARQVALVRPERLYKLERVVVYRDQTAAVRALAERRDALVRCADHPEPDGVHTVWRFEALDIGDEAMFVAGQRMRSTDGLPGHHRGVLMRQGRVLVMFVDFGQATTLAEPEEGKRYQQDAAVMADRLRSAHWA
jgi:hypothetical protein